MTRRLLPAILAAAVLMTGCTPDHDTTPQHSVTGPGALGPVTEASADNRIAVPGGTGRGSVAATVPAAATPTKAPAQAAGLGKQALPTNQWWSSALTGPGTQPMWAHPLAVRVGASGVQLSSAPVTAAANAITTPFVPALSTAATGATSVVGYGAFHVVLRVALAGGGTVDMTVVSGSPVVWLRFRGTTARLSALGAVRDLGDSGGLARLDIAGQRWDVAGTGLTLSGADLTGTDPQMAVARVPDGVDAASWEKEVTAAAADPVMDTTATMAYDAGSGTVTQTLTATRASGRPGLWALLPHQRAGLVPGPEPLAGTYPDARGTLSLVESDRVQVRVPLPGLLTGVPRVDVGADQRRAVVADLDRDLADKPAAGGSYFGLKELGRLASIAEVAAAVGATAQQQAALARLKPQLVDWLTYSAPADPHYLAYDRTWGGLIAVPAEFGSQDYNDHHFQYGYLVRAASVLAAVDPGFRHDYGGVVDLVVRDFAGSRAVPSAGGGFPPFRSFNAYLGSSAASGFAPFADGNNQESSSEAVAAWEAVTRWGQVRGDAALTEFGATHYAMEAATARRYWLGEDADRPPGYAHTTAGIVWDAKIDYATWFDPKPESVLGIQLLPLTFGSLYRSSPTAATARDAELRAAVGGPPRAWGDLFAADLAVADPEAARARLDAGVPREPGTSRGLVRYFVDVLATLGPPQPGVVAPLGSLAFGSAKQPRRVSADPGG
ncbi:glycosyl hydrolase [Krasilnikovia sp. MM14-A1259]|uniref:glycosyl hydrolase n=1 Tax=Krasilnikovia sp. MM14-A1259 TaxID=3373539 RepID=UPI00381A48A6